MLRYERAARFGRFFLTDGAPQDELLMQYSQYELVPNLVGIPFVVFQHQWRYFNTKETYVRHGIALQFFATKASLWVRCTGRV